MNTSTIFGLAWRLGLWASALWGVLRLHDMSFAHEYSICGPWGCGPTVPALLAAHGFWLLLLIPGSLWASRLFIKDRVRLAGWVCLGLGLGGIVAVSLSEVVNLIQSEDRSYSFQRILFALATTIDLPIFPGTLAGLILLKASRRGSEVCENDLCGLPESHEGQEITTRIEVGQPWPEFTFRTHDGEAFVLPEVASGRASILYFMRSAECSICRKHVRTLVKIFDQIQALGADVLILQPGSDEASKALAYSLSTPFPIASGRDSGVYQAIGRFGPFPRSGTLVIDCRGLVRSVRLTNLPFGAFSEAELFEVIRGLEDACPVGGME